LAARFSDSIYRRMDCANYLDYLRCHRHLCIRSPLTYAYTFTKSRPRKDKRGFNLISDVLPFLPTVGTPGQTPSPTPSDTRSISAVHMML
jgi:hypothetical protein